MSADLNYSLVAAVTLNPDFVDLYAQKGAMFSTYKPTVQGERGWMEHADAVAAAGAGDALIAVAAKPVDIVPPPGRKLPQQLGVSVHTAGAPDQPGIIHLQPGLYDGIYTFTLTIAIDGGGDVVDSTVATTAGEKSENIAVAVAALVLAGVTLTPSTNPNSIIVTPTVAGTALTKLEATLA